MANMAIKSFQKNLNSNRIIESENLDPFTRSVPPKPQEKLFIPMLSIH